MKEIRRVQRPDEAKAALRVQRRRRGRRARTASRPEEQDALALQLGHALAARNRGLDRLFASRQWHRRRRWRPVWTTFSVLMPQVVGERLRFLGGHAVHPGCQCRDSSDQCLGTRRRQSTRLQLFVQFTLLFEQLFRDGLDLRPERGAPGTSRTSRAARAFIPAPPPMLGAAYSWSASCSSHSSARALVAAWAHCAAAWRPRRTYIPPGCGAFGPRDLRRGDWVRR